MSKIFRVDSSHGTIYTEVDSGKVVKVEYYDELDRCLDNIMKFDIKEFENFYKEQEYGVIESQCVVDILDLGYWYCEYEITDDEEFHQCVKDLKIVMGDLKTN